MSSKKNEKKEVLPVFPQEIVVVRNNQTEMSPSVNDINPIDVDELVDNEVVAKYELVHLCRVNRSNCLTPIVKSKGK